MIGFGQTAHRAEPLEAVGQFVTFLEPADHHWRQLAVSLQGTRHGALRFGHVQAVATIVFADFLTLQLQQIVAGPAQHACPSFRGHDECKSAGSADSICRDYLPRRTRPRSAAGSRPAPAPLPLHDAFEGAPAWA
jgi:hypothetical protein